LLEPELKSLIAGFENEYQFFVSMIYAPYRRYTMQSLANRKIPFSIYSVIDFIFHTVGCSSVGGDSLKSKMKLKADSNFKPHLFDRLYIYSNIVKPVDYDDQQIRLMDIVYLQPKPGGNYGVVDYRSVLFQDVDVDVLNNIHILVTTSLGRPAPFMHGPMCLTLHFRQRD
jgi:hypothetical protein